MQVVTSLDSPLLIAQPAALTVGTFDGIHLGHQALLKSIRDLCKAKQLISAVITFKNHPSCILRPNHPCHLLTTPEHKLKLFESQGVDLVFLLEFTQKFADQCTDSFLDRVNQVLPFRSLILGYDAKLGKDRQGDEALISALAIKRHFSVDYLKPHLMGGKPVSSSTIRKCIQEDNFALASKLLGRPYSIYKKVLFGRGKGKKMGFPTANFDVEQLVIPSFGVYAVKFKVENRSYSGIANLGFAPTLRSDHKPLLEVHVFDTQENFYDKFAEVVFVEFIRPERQFENADLLKTQIAKDIISAKKILHHED